MKYNERVSRIQQRLSDIQVSIENDRQDKLLNLDRSLNQTDVELTQWQEQNLKKFGQFKEKVTECLKYIETDKQARDYEHEVQLREIEQLEQSIQERFYQEKIARKDMETRLLNSIEEKFLGVRKTLSQESRNRYESIE